MIALDASVLIAYLDADDVHHDDAAALLEEFADSQFTASPITHAEVLVGPARLGRVDEVELALEAIGVETAPLPDDAPRRLAILRAETGRRMPDCCVLLAALQSKARLATFDVQLARSAQALGLQVVPAPQFSS